MVILIVAYTYSVFLIFYFLIETFFKEQIKDHNKIEINLQRYYLPLFFLIECTTASSHFTLKVILCSVGGQGLSMENYSLLRLLAT